MNSKRKELLALSNENLFLPCPAIGNPKPIVQWSVPYGITLRYPYVNEEYIMDENGALQILNIQPRNAGLYICEAINDFGKDKIQIEVKMKEIAPVVVSPKFNSIKTIKSGNLTIRCEATGLPKPRISWILPASVILTQGQTNGRITIDQDGVLIVNDVREVDAGQYSCLTRNSAGEDSGTVSVFLIPPPKIDMALIPNRVITIWGNKTMIDCPLDLETSSNYRMSHGSTFGRRRMRRETTLYKQHSFYSGSGRLAGWDGDKLRYFHHSHTRLKDCPPNPFSIRS